MIPSSFHGRSSCPTISPSLSAIAMTLKWCSNKSKVKQSIQYENPFFVILPSPTPQSTTKRFILSHPTSIQSECSLNHFLAKGFIFVSLTFLTTIKRFSLHLKVFKGKKKLYDGVLFKKNSHSSSFLWSWIEYYWIIEDAVNSKLRKSFSPLC